jgi:hypothetical protein
MPAIIATDRDQEAYVRTTRNLVKRTPRLVIHDREHRNVLRVRRRIDDDKINLAVAPLSRDMKERSCGAAVLHVIDDAENAEPPPRGELDGDEVQAPVLVWQR